MIIRQAFSLLRQNPFFSTVSIIGTAVSIAFVMVVYMVYDIHTDSNAIQHIKRTLFIIR